MRGRDPGRHSTGPGIKLSLTDHSERHHRIFLNPSHPASRLDRGTQNTNIISARWDCPTPGPPLHSVANRNGVLRTDKVPFLPNGKDAIPDDNDFSSSFFLSLALCCFCSTLLRGWPGGFCSNWVGCRRGWGLGVQGDMDVFFLSFPGMGWDERDGRGFGAGGKYLSCDLGCLYKVLFFSFISFPHVVVVYYTLPVSVGGSYCLCCFFRIYYCWPVGFGCLFSDTWRKMARWK